MSGSDTISNWLSDEKVEDVYYKTSNNSTLPDYIKNLSGAQRTKYYDNLIMLQPEVAIFPIKSYKNILWYVQVVGSIIAFELPQNINR